LRQGIYEGAFLELAEWVKENEIGMKGLEEKYEVREERCQ
jgi:hypothetical protein